MYKDNGDLKRELFFEEAKEKTLLYLHKHKELLRNEDYYYAYEFLMKREIGEIVSFSKCEDTQNVRCGIDLALDVEVLERGEKIENYKNIVDKMVKIINRCKVHIKE
jgi:hypothetical protein